MESTERSITTGDATTAQPSWEKQMDGVTLTGGLPLLSAHPAGGLAVSRSRSGGEVVTLTAGTYPKQWAIKELERVGTDSRSAGSSEVFTDWRFLKSRFKNTN